MRKCLFQQTGISQSQYYKLGLIEKSDVEFYNKVLEKEVSISKAYLDLNKMNTIT